MFFCIIHIRILRQDNSRPIHSTSDVPNRRKIRYRPALQCVFHDSGAGYQIADLLTYIHI